MAFNPDSAWQPANTFQEMQFVNDGISNLLTDSVTAVVPGSSRFGEPGILLPHAAHTDNLLTTSLLLCFILFVIALAASGRSMAQQFKQLIFTTYDTDDNLLTGRSPFLHLLALADCLLLGVCSYLLATERIATHYIVESHFLMVLILTGLFAIYFLLKRTVYSLVNIVFFGGKRTLQWDGIFLFVVSAEAFMLFPLVLLLVYFDLSIENAVYYFSFVLILNKILTFYESWRIFFRQSSGFMQNFLYFCALEITPLLAVGGSWLIIINTLKVIF